MVSVAQYFSHIFAVNFLFRVLHAGRSNYGYCPSPVRMLVQHTVIPSISLASYTKPEPTHRVRKQGGVKLLIQKNNSEALCREQALNYSPYALPLRYIKDWVCKYLIQKVMGVVYLRKETCDEYETWPWPLSC